MEKRVPVVVTERTAHSITVRPLMPLRGPATDYVFTFPEGADVQIASLGLSPVRKP